MVTQKAAIFAIRAMGLSVRVDAGEYRVNYRNGTEASAYYTDDAEDAVATARSMADALEVRAAQAETQARGGQWR